jgi:broad specificity phosphatase PhoE
MDIIVVRHGQTEANKSGVIGTDSNLTEEGKQQAKELGDKLSREQIDVIYCSPLKRTSQTALPGCRIHFSRKPLGWSQETRLIPMLTTFTNITEKAQPMSSGACGHLSMS